MQMIAVSWLVYRLTNSVFYLGLVSFIGQIPSFAIAPFLGVFVDRHNKLTIIKIAQVLSMIQAFTLAYLVISGHINVYHIIGLSFLLGLVNSVELPARQSYVIDLIENKADLGNAIALNSMMVNISRLLGPSMAGILIALFGEGICFMLNGISFLAVIISLFSIKIVAKIKTEKKAHPIHDLIEGVRYVFGFLPIRLILMTLGLNSFLGAFSQTLLPVFARDVFHGNSQTIGFMAGSSGLGALCGAFYLASRKSVLGLGNIIAYGTCVVGAGLIIYAFTSIYQIALLLLFFVGIGSMLQMAACNTMIQTIVDDNKRGRVMSFYAMAFMGMPPFGALVAGILAGHFGVHLTVFISGLGCLTSFIFFFLNLKKIRQLIRPIYIKKEIIRV